MEFKARSNQKDLLPEGKFVAIIKAAAETLSKANDTHKDRTPQIELKFETLSGFIIHWFNLKGYKKNADGTVSIDKKGNRVEDSENTASAISIFERVGLHAGIAKDQSFTMEDLIGRKIGICVEKNDRNSLRVKYTMPADKVAAPAVATEEAAD